METLDSSTQCLERLATCEVNAARHRKDIRKLASNNIAHVRLIMSAQNEITRLKDILNMFGLPKYHIGQPITPSDEGLAVMGPRAVMGAIEVNMRSLVDGTMTTEQAKQDLQEWNMFSEDVWEILEGRVGASPEREQK